MNKKMIISIFILVVIDFLSKLIIRNSLKLLDTINVIRNFFNITFVKNTGAAWGMMKGNTLFLIIISIIMFIILIYYMKENKEYNKLSFISYSLIIAGLLGNLIDRIFLGYVVDFLSFKFGSYYFPVFNIADSYIVIGIILLIGDELYERINSRKRG